MPEAVIVSAARSPIGRANKGSLTEMRPDELTAFIVRTALDKIPELDAATIDDHYLGCGLPGGESGNNMARIVNVLNGMDEVPGATITRYCSSSVQTTRMAFHAIKAGEGDVFLSSGVETVSRFAKGTSDHWPDTNNTQFDDAKARTATMAEGGQDWHDPREDGQLPDIYIAMGQTAENVARLRNLDRKELDEFGVRSQNLAEKAIEAGFWAREITPVETPSGVVSTDDGPRAGVTYDGIKDLKPVFRPDGVVTAGNCCALNDGAAAVVIMSDTKAAELGVTPLARIVSTGVSGLSPEIMGLGPVEATKRALAHAGMSIGDIDLVEINEAFAAQVVPSYQELGIDLDRLNVNGGAIAVGHPFGMTGARLQNTMLNSLDFHDKSTGLITMCVGGGQGMALILERNRLIPRLGLHSLRWAWARRDHRPGGWTATSNGRGVPWSWERPCSSTGSTTSCVAGTTSRSWSTRSSSGSPSATARCGWRSWPTPWPTAGAGSPTRSPGWRGRSSSSAPPPRRTAGASSAPSPTAVRCSSTTSHRPTSKAYATTWSTSSRRTTSPPWDGS